jgi:hypothetical protein
MNRASTAGRVNLQRSNNAHRLPIRFTRLSAIYRVHNGSSLFAGSRLATWIVALNYLFVGSDIKETRVRRISYL